MAKLDVNLIRNPEDWARDHGWVSRRRAQTAASQLRALAFELGELIEGDFDSTLEEMQGWKDTLETLAKYLAPQKTPAQRKLERAKKQGEW